MPRTIIATLLFLHALAASPCFAQHAATAESEQTFPTPMLVGATVGSAAGFMVWWHTGGPFTSTGPSLGRLWLSTTVGTALGAWVTAAPGDRPSLSQLVVGSSFGLVGGVLLTLITASVLDGPNSEPPGPLLVLSFSIGQGTVAALVGS